MRWWILLIIQLICLTQIFYFFQLPDDVEKIMYTSDSIFNERLKAIRHNLEIQYDVVVSALTVSEKIIEPLLRLLGNYILLSLYLTLLLFTFAFQSYYSIYCFGFISLFSIFKFIKSKLGNRNRERRRPTEIKNITN